MKNFVKWFGIIALAAVIGFSMAGCDNPAGGDNTGDNGKKPGDTVTPGDPALTGSVTITGDPDVGVTLTAVTSALGGEGDISYQWKKGGTDISGANSGTYAIVVADIGTTITVTVTRAGYSGSVSSAPTELITNPSNPALSGTVSISGVAKVNETLTAVTTSLGGDSVIVYQWKRNSTEGGTATIVGTNSSTYAVQEADVGATITVTVIRMGNSGRITSTPTAPVIAIPPLTGDVSIGGTAIVGSTLTASPAGMNGEGTITYQWNRGGTAIPDTNSDTYVVQAADVGSKITVSVTYSGNTGSVSSDPTDFVTNPSNAALTGTVTIAGTAAVGSTLTAVTTSLGGSGTIHYQWKRGVINIGTDSATYVVQEADVGSTISVTVIRNNNSGSQTGGPTATVTAVLTGTVSISGTAQVGETLTAVTTALGGVGTITYQWKRGGIDVGTNNTYVVQSADVGSTITVTVTRTGYFGDKTSSPTATVTLPPLTGTVSISGTAEVGQTLTAITTSLDGSGGTISYQWKRGGTDIGTNNSTYTIVVADLSSTITVTVTRTGYTGSKTSDPTATVEYGIGSTGPGGGKIFYKKASYSDGWQYLEAAPADLPGTYMWASAGYQSTNIYGTSGEIGTGKANTTRILAVDENAPAAKACVDYQGGDLSDWFLASSNELDELNKQKNIIGYTFQNDSSYWSSSQLDGSIGRVYRFSTGGTLSTYKNTAFYVRPIRQF